MTTRIVILAALCASMVSGCGATLARVASNDQTMPQEQAAKAHRGPRGILADLNLTADQKTQLKALMQKARGAKAAPDPALRERFHAIWTAPTLDQAALKALIQERRAAGAAKRDAHVALLVEGRNILTPEQREKIAAGLEGQLARMQGHQGKGRRPQGEHAGVLTDAQKAQLQALMQKRHGGQRMQAFAAFARSGDAAALSAALAGADVTDDAVAFAATLSQEQRTKLERRAQMLLGVGGGGFGKGGGWRQHKPGGHRGGQHKQV